MSKRVARNVTWNRHPVTIVIFSISLWRQGEARCKAVNLECTCLTDGPADRVRKGLVRVFITLLRTGHGFLCPQSSG